MRKLLLIAKRDYVAAVRTKAFLVGLLVPPLLFGGSFLATAVLKGKANPQVRRIAVVDRTGAGGAAVVQQLKQQNGLDQRQSLAKFDFDMVTPDVKDPDGQRLALSNQVRNRELLGFLEIEISGAQWYSNQSGFGETERALAVAVSDAFRRVHLKALGISAADVEEALKPAPLKNMNLITRDPKTGRITPARTRSIAESFAGPFILAFLFFILVLSTSAPMLSAVAEDKTQRVFEMLLASATPFDLIGGKVLAAVGTALTSSLLYVVGTFFVLESLAIVGFTPLKILPWFFLYLIAEVVMLSSMASALGAACNSTRDAENLKLITLLPVMIPMLVLTAVLQDPNGVFATAMSFVPLFTPILMLIRQASATGLPAWQPWVGLAGVVATSVLIAWMASRIFRLAILFQGKTPKLGELIRLGMAG